MILTFRPAWRSFTTSYVVFLALVAIFPEPNFFVFLPIFYVLYERYSVQLNLTNDALIFSKGFFRRQHVVIPLSNIELLPITQTTWQRLIGIGTVSVLDSCNANSIILFRGMREPQRFYEELLHWQKKLMLNYPIFEQNF